MPKGGALAVHAQLSGQTYAGRPDTHQAGRMTGRASKPRREAAVKVTSRHPGTHVGYLGRQWAILIALAIRPIRPRVASNAITPRPTANLVGPPLLVLLGLPVVASDHTEQISHGPLTFKDGMVTHRTVSSVSTGGFCHRSTGDGLHTRGRFSRRLQLAPGLVPPTSWSLPPVGPI